MALPKIESPKYHLTIPSTGDVIEYRPFLVAEEKILLLAQETGTQAAMISALKDIVKACTFGAIDLYSLAMYDLEYIFLNLRAKSVGETSNIRIKCDQCEEYVDVEIDLTEVEVKGELAENNIPLTEDIGITLKVPGLNDAEKAAKTQNNDPIVESIAALIDTIYDAESVYKADESTPKELKEFIESLTHQQLEKIQGWMQEMPKIEHDIKFTCKNGHENERKLTGLGDFFV